MQFDHRRSVDFVKKVLSPEKPILGDKVDVPSCLPRVEM